VSEIQAVEVRFDANGQYLEGKAKLYRA